MALLRVAVTDADDEGFVMIDRHFDDDNALTLAQGLHALPTNHFLDPTSKRVLGLGAR
ncbi:hypothetical protein MD484_g2617, partial [Candolleomyces efflorescens]